MGSQATNGLTTTPIQADFISRGPRPVQRRLHTDGWRRRLEGLQRPIEGEYCRVAFEQGKISQIEVIKDYLFSIGWVPDEWNMEKVNGKFIKKSPKITESSLEALGGSAMQISEYYTVRARKGILEGWINEVEQADGRLHGRMWTIGTPTFRCRHEVVANIPGVNKDKAGNILMGLCLLPTC